MREVHLTSLSLNIYDKNHLKFTSRLFIFRGIFLIGILPRNILLRGIFLRRDFAGGIFLWRDLEGGIFQRRDFCLEGFCTPAGHFEVLNRSKS